MKTKPTNSAFIGREPDLAALKAVDYKLKSTISVIYGRRRVGKTSLVEEAFKHTKVIKFEGLEDKPEEEQRAHFVQSFARITGQSEHKFLDSSNWTSLLIALSEYLKKKPTIIFLDEYQWLAEGKSSLTSELKFVWDNYFLKNNKVHLIICGSVSSFIVKNVLNSKALYGRIDNVIHLYPLSLRQSCIEYFPKTRNIFSVFEYYLAVGGIPKYLELYDTTDSFQRNVERLWLRPTGYLFSELDRLLVSHFGKKKIYRKIIKMLAERSPATQSNIQKMLNIRSGGRLSEYMEDLSLAGFIEEYSPVKSRSTNYLKRYRINDPYLRFHFRFIAPHFSRIKSHPTGLSFSNVIKDAQYEIWRGLAFEHCCRENHQLIAKILGFSGINYSQGSWFKKADQTAGSQIDLVFLRADNVATLCEVKYQAQFGQKLNQEILVKEERLRTEANPSVVQKVLITAQSPTAEAIKTGNFDRIITLEEMLQ